MKRALVLVALVACKSGSKVAYKPCDGAVRALATKLDKGSAKDLVGTQIAFENCRLSTASDDDITFTTVDDFQPDIRCKMSTAAAKAATKAAHAVKGDVILVDVRATIRELDDGRVLPTDCKVRVHD